MVTGVANMAQIAPGLDHICAALSDHTAVCWGSDAFGQLGNGVSSSTRAPDPQHAQICP